MLFLYIILSLFLPHCEHEYSRNCAYQSVAGESFVTMDIGDGMDFIIYADGTVSIQEAI